ncbi:prokaryotic cytochrome C oxidase subunit IV [Leptospira sp. 2 VSF19]|uniref:Prokaryotic cytochrome C oxidase subunit IV n=1 Tax=Leptospira soteropolitanensis TaxID=2950025 RepID=A0AAW5VEX3_9LEPT|nr:prokaryotic cytochrome C oxidase subunit IV [Leptospira soteropolitanensis]MCW7491067.1 prokaryotic cytochrome C oxidase subunit IV [Leptospira soteropolitanensis]MCW7498651.1 prokaryotic cytochrome C oxidase subunit IV [Leptospira soteropolitanensis]MCW7521756.1 prokaryotic cytochrome C oxidase subunit IV [Leptospira soteropolitanensis]MCW7524755.1 prokaryotic cytochrome C oxidase subunit IV [Leptospira soteropolitanensis]MCW7528622.1 prokaryotic cytochrome C oxidase subunit IV [Leptospira
MKSILLTYVVLLAIVYYSFFGMGSLLPATWNLILMSAIKFLLICFVFMNLKTAHPFWKVAFPVLIGIYSMSIWFLT